MDEQLRGTAVFRARRRARVAALARTQDGMLSRRQVYAAGVTRSEAKAEIRAGRWSAEGRHCLRIGPVNARQKWWRALLEVGAGAVLDGASALIHAGLRGVDERVVHVSVPKSSTPARSRGVRVHETRRYREDEILRNGVPRTRPETAAVRAALWAKSDEQATLFLVTAVQQGLTTAGHLRTALARVRRDVRRPLLHAVLDDIATGVHSMGELEFARLCAGRRLPTPTRQVVRETPSGRRYYDVDFDPYGVSVEVDGAQHLDAAAAVPDALKQNEAVIGGRTVLRIPVWALRTDPGPFLDQLASALRRRGWNPGGDAEAS